MVHLRERKEMTEERLRSTKNKQRQMAREKLEISSKNENNRRRRLPVKERVEEKSENPTPLRWFGKMFCWIE